MRVRALVVIAVLSGCPPKTPNTGPIEYVGGTDRHPGVPVDAGPDAPPCILTTEVAPLKMFFGTLPAGTSEDAAYNAVLQFFVAAGGPGIQNQDPFPHTIITKRFGGQILFSTCAINRYFVYALRIVVTGTTMIVDMDCWESVGWESYVLNGVAMPRNRSDLHVCVDPRYVSQGDATIPSQIFEGALSLLSLGRPPPQLPRFVPVIAMPAPHDTPAARSLDATRSATR
jgi:hypothetical protein